MPTNGCNYEGCSAKPGEEDRDYIYNVVHSSDERRINSEKVDSVLSNTVKVELGFVSPVLYLGFLAINDERATASDMAFAVLPGIGELGELAPEGTNLLRWVAKASHTDGIPWTVTFKDPQMSVFDEALGATPELVQQVMGKGSGAVYGLNASEVLKVPGVTAINKVVGTTGNAILDAAHFEVINSGSNPVAKA